MRQEQALQLLKMGKNVFLTGAAGSGKTYLLNQYIQYLKTHHVSVSVTASTGIAATHLQGSTIHAWSGIGVKDVLTEKDLEKILTTSHLKRNYQKTKVLIIDEVSMLHAHQLDMVDQAARFVLGNNKPFLYRVRKGTLVCSPALPLRMSFNTVNSKSSDCLCCSSR